MQSCFAAVQGGFMGRFSVGCHPVFPTGDIRGSGCFARVVRSERRITEVQWPKGLVHDGTFMAPPLPRASRWEAAYSRTRRYGTGFLRASGREVSHSASYVQRHIVAA